ncbi:MAG TPA: hydrogenase maturation nickel metallochaperone HypA [Anaerolineae bacterium]|nr:hydrogenase maturation nickel metallochaperone HypA [Anaerolineae bacterium]
MHELPVTQSILDIALRHAAKANATHILAVHLTIGELTGFIDDSIQFYFDFLTRDTPAAGARLTFDRIPARARCRSCDAEYAPPDSRIWTCPECGALGGDVVAGREFSVSSIEVE